MKPDPIPVMFRCSACGTRGRSPVCHKCGDIINPYITVERVAALDPIPMPEEDSP